MTDNKTQKGGDARQAALHTLIDVLDRGLDLESAFNRHSTGLEPRDRAFARNLCMVSLRRQGSLNACLGRLLERPLPAKHKFARYVLILGLAQILLMDTAPHAAVGLAVEQVKAHKPTAHLAGLVNAVLRRAAGARDKLAARLNKSPLEDLPRPVRERWTAHWGRDKCQKMARTLQFTPDTDITLKSGEDTGAWAKKLDARVLPGGSLRVNAGDVRDLPGFADGSWWVQDAAASLPAKLLSVHTGETALDLCAAPGGKTMQLASSGASVTALDRSQKRIKRLEDNLARTGLSADVVVADALYFQPDKSFDAILLDAPCSASGTFRRNPDVLWTKDKDDIKKLAQLQEKLLDHAIRLLKPGGRLVYCVCSLEPEEGEAQWADFLARNEGSVAAQPIAGEELGGDASPIAAMLHEDGTLRTMPLAGPPRMTIDGFFIARAVRCRD